MDLAGTIGRAIVGADALKPPVFRGAREENLNAGKSESPTTKADAVQPSVVDVAEVTAAEKAAAGEEREETANEREEHLSREEAEKLAERLKAALGQTEVKFHTEDQKDAKGELHFTVVDKQTGKVLREFPQKNLETAVEKIFGSHGIVVDESV